MSDAPANPLLILDLDETLIHGARRRLHRDADFMVGSFHIYQRPYLNEFLEIASQYFDTAVWSSASSIYVDTIAGELESRVVKWEFVWSRDRCVQRFHTESKETYFIKDLRKVKRLGFHLDQVLIVDDTPSKVSRNYGNAIYIPPFEGEDEDSELVQLGKYLRALHSQPNFRTIEKRGWRRFESSRFED